LFVAENQLVPLLDADVQTLAHADADAGVVDEAARAGVLDVVAVVGPGGVASFTLADGTVLTVTRLSNDQGNPGALGTATDATFRDCERCGVVDTSGAVARVRLAGSTTSMDSAQLSDVKVSSSGSSARRVRWEVLELP
jgi:hypothetical protein